MQGENWMPLESNPEVINAFISKMGLKTNIFNFQEILSLEEWALQMILQPTLGIIFLYSQTPPQEMFKKNESESLHPQTTPKQIFFMKQYARNACGTIALFHIVLNALATHPQIVENESYLSRFKVQTKEMNPSEKASKFKESKEILQEHKSAAHQGQTQAQPDCDSHFIAFVPFNGRIFEMDGCKKCPVDHGPVNQQNFLSVAAGVIQGFMQRDPQNNNFSMIALAKNAEL